MQSSDTDEWFIYLLRCRDGSLYAGVTRDLQRRLCQHNGELSGGARYTRGRRPVKLVWSQSVSGRGQAQKLEASLKRLSRAAKQDLVRRGGAVPLQALEDSAQDSAGDQA